MQTVWKPVELCPKPVRTYALSVSHWPGTPDDSTMVTVVVAEYKSFMVLRTEKTEANMEFLLSLIEDNIQNGWKLVSASETIAYLTPTGDVIALDTPQTLLENTAPSETAAMHNRPA